MVWITMKGLLELDQRPLVEVYAITSSPAMSPKAAGKSSLLQLEAIDCSI